MFAAFEVDARYVYAGTPLQERKQLIQDFRDGKFPVLINCGMWRAPVPAEVDPDLVLPAILTEGADIPNIDCVVLARPTRSKNVFAQMVRPTYSPPSSALLPCPFSDVANRLVEACVSQRTRARPTVISSISWRVIRACRGLSRLLHCLDWIRGMWISPVRGVLWILFRGCFGCQLCFVCFFTGSDSTSQTNVWNLWNSVSTKQPPRSPKTIHPRAFCPRTPRFPLQQGSVTSTTTTLRSLLGMALAKEAQGRCTSRG